MSCYNALQGKNHLDDADRAILSQIAKKIAQVHMSKVPIGLNETDLYQKGYQEMIINPEITFDVLSAFPRNHAFF